MKKEIMKEAKRLADQAEKLCEKYNIYFDEAHDIVYGDRTLNEVLEEHKMNKEKLNEEVVEDTIEDVESSQDEKITLLADYLGVDPEDIEQSTYDDNVYIVDTDAEYLVCTEDEAEDYARQNIEDVWDDLGLESFTEDFQDWVVNYAIDEDYLETSVRDYIEMDIYDLVDEDVVEKAIDYDLIDREDAFEEDEDGFLVIKDDVIIDDLKEQLVDAEFDEIDDYAGWIEAQFGRDYLADMISSDPDIVDMDKLVDECIDWDGIAHFVATYDGNELDLGHDLYAYRIN